MILDRISASRQYDLLGPRFALALGWLRSVEVSKLEPGRLELQGQEVYALIQENNSKPLDQAGWEAHRKYADIQFVVIGMEQMQWESLEQVTLGAYDESRDFQALSTTTWTSMNVSAGMFTVFFPTDAHRPGISVPGVTRLVKIVVKVQI